MNAFKHVGWLSTALLLVLMVACSSSSSSTSNGIKANTWYPVGNVINNNTFEIIVGDDIEKVTFLSIDIPDIAISEQYNLPIKSFLEEKLTSQEVKLTFDKEMRNEQGHLLAIVTLRDGTNLNEQLLEIGYAKVLIQEPNVLNENIYKQLEQLSKTNQNGIWSNETETSNVDVSIKEKVFSGISLSVNKKLQQAKLINHTNQAVDLNNWMLVSVTGNETHLFESIILEPGENVIVYATDTSPNLSGHLVYWGKNAVWHDQDKEIAELYNNNKELMAIWSE